MTDSGNEGGGLEMQLENDEETTIKKTVDYSTIDKFRAITMKGLPMALVAAEGDNFTTQIQDVLTEKWTIPGDAVSDIHRIPTMFNGVELDVHALVVFKSRINRNRVWQQRSKAENGMEICAVEIPEPPKPAPEPEEATPEPVPEKSDPIPEAEESEQPETTTLDTDSIPDPLLNVAEESNEPPSESASSPAPPAEQPDVSTVDKTKALSLRGLSMAIMALEGEEFKNDVRELIVKAFGLTSDALSDIYRIPIINHGVETDIEALLVFRSRIHRTRVFTNRNKVESPMEIIHANIPQKETTPEPEMEAGEVEEESAGADNGHSENNDNDSFQNDEGAVTIEDEDEIEVIEEIKKKVISFDGAPEFQWRNPRSEMEYNRIILLNATLETLKHPFIYKWCVGARNVYFAFNHIPGIRNFDHSILSHGRLSINFHGPDAVMDCAIQSLVHYRSPPGKPRLKILLPNCPESMSRVKELEKKLGETKKPGKRGRQLLVQELGGHLKEADIRRKLGPRVNVEKIEINKDILGCPCAIITFPSCKQAIEYHMKYPELDLGDKIESENSAENGKERDANVLFMEDVVPRAYILRHEAPAVKRKVGGHEFFENEPDDVEEYIEEDNVDERKIGANDDVDNDTQEIGSRIAAANDNEDYEETRESLAAQKRAILEKNRKRGRKGDNLEEELDPDAKRSASISEATNRGRWRGGGGGGWRGGWRGRGGYDGGYGGRGRGGYYNSGLRDLFYNRNTGPPSYYHGMGGPPEANPIQQLEMQQQLRKQQDAINDLAEELSRKRQAGHQPADLFSSEVGSSFNRSEGGNDDNRWS